MTTPRAFLLSIFVAALLLSCPVTKAQESEKASTAESDVSSKAATIWTLELQGNRDQEMKLAKELANIASPEWAAPWAKGVVCRLTSIGKRVDMDFIAVDGRRCDLKEMRGKVVLIHFWATWCPPCVEGMQKLRQLYSKYHTQGLEVIGISWDNDKGKLVKFIDENQLKWPVYFDGTKPGKWGVALGIGGVPYLLLLDRSGQLRYCSADENAVIDSAVPELMSEQ